MNIEQDVLPNTLRDTLVTPLVTVPTTTTSRDTTTSRTEALPRTPVDDTRIITSLHWHDHLTGLIATIRPDWHPKAIRAAATDRHGTIRDVITAAIACALDPDTRTPGRIAIYDVRQPTPLPPSLRCPHGVAAAVIDGQLEGIGCTRCYRPAPMPTNVLDTLTRPREDA